MTVPNGSKNAFDWLKYRQKRGGFFQKLSINFASRKIFSMQKVMKKNAVNMEKTVFPVQYFSDIGIENIYN